MGQKPVIHGGDHRPPGWNSLTDPGGADPLAWLVLPPSGIQFDTYPQSGGWLYVEATSARPGNWGIEFKADDPNGIWLHQGTGANFSEITLFNSGTNDGTAYTQAQYIIIDPGVSLTVRSVIGGVLHETFRVDADGSIHGRTATGAITWDL